MTLRYLSLFSGIEACSVAWEPLGWTPVAFAEIEPFPCALLAHRFPHVPNLGDVTQITDEQVAALGPIDLVVGGSPCQDLSVAGKRAGLVGARSSLFHEQVRLFHAARTFCDARWLVWENVPGAFSTHGGRDFARMVGDLAGCELAVPAEGWGSEGVALGDRGLVEWAVLDAQWFGVAQRRRRVFAVLDVGNWQGRPPVLLEPESLRGDSAPRREAGEGTPARTLRSSTGGVDREDGHSLIPEICPALKARDSKGPSSDGDGDGACLIPTAFAQNQRDEVRTMDVAGALLAEPGMKQSTYVAFDPSGAGKQTTLSASASASRFGALGTTKVPGVLAPSLTATNDPSRSPQSAEVTQQVGAVYASAMQVRRLTPTEAERLQGFPDGWTAIPYRGKPSADGPRYRALGNSMAVPCMVWIGRQIARAHAPSG